MAGVEVTTLEHSTMKVPYELLNKKFRAVQKVIDREVTHVGAAVTDLSTVCSRQSVVPFEAAMALDGVSQKLASLKRKAQEGIDEELECTRLCKTRLDHLKAYASGEMTQGMQNAWRRVRTDRMLVDHFLRAGHYGTAMSLAQTSNIEDYVDVSVFEVCQKVESGLRSHNTCACLAWCHENRSKLRRQKSTLEYRVRLQDFVELVRQGRRMDAVRYARKHLANGGEEMLGDLKSAMALLAFTPETPCRKYQRLFSIKRWDDLIQQFRQDNLSLYQLNSQSILLATL